MTETTWQALIAAVVTVILAGMQMYSKRDSDKRFISLQGISDKTHGLVNSAMTVQLEINKVSTRALAEVTKRPEHVAAADLAEDTLEKHILGQKQLK